MTEWLVLSISHCISIFDITIAWNQAPNFSQDTMIQGCIHVRVNIEDQQSDLGMRRTGAVVSTQDSKVQKFRLQRESDDNNGDQGNKLS